MIEIEHLCKKYNKIYALDNVSINIRKGVYGLIGENGAGKSTLLKILMQQIPYDSGNIRILNKNIEGNLKLKMGYLPQKFDFFYNVTIYDSMKYLARLKNIVESEISNEINFWLNYMNLISIKEKRVKELSGGMKQRLGIAQAFMGNPDIIILDEPTVGLDPKERLAFRNMVNEMGEDKTIIISTHIIEDVSSTCEFLNVLHEGKILFNGSVEQFINSVSRKIYTIRVSKEELLCIGKEVDIISIKRLGKEIEIRYMEAKEKSNSDLALYSEKKERKCTLEDAYFFHTDMYLRKEQRL